MNNIRELLSSDREQFLNLLTHLTKVEPLTQEEFDSILLYNNNYSKTFVLVENEKLLGTVKIAIDRKFARKGGKLAFFEDFVVLPEARGKGLGSLLIKYASEFA